MAYDPDSNPAISLADFEAAAKTGSVVAIGRRLMSDQLTPVLGYRRLVSADERTAPSFLFESVVNGDAVGRHSFIGARPAIEVLARGHDVTITDHRSGDTRTEHHDNPLAVMKSITAEWTPAETAGTPDAFCGGWVGYAGYDTVRYLEPEKLTFENAPHDDRGLADLHFGLYLEVAVFDHVEKVLHAVVHVPVNDHPTSEDAWRAGCTQLDAFVNQLQAHSVPLPAGAVDLDPSAMSGQPLKSNFERADFEAGVERCREYIGAGDAFQIVISQRFERTTQADPFEVYRALRVINPSPYMIYLQAEGSILVASSPEILCRCHNRTVTNRPLAGTRKRGSTDELDKALEEELRNDAKECAEHVMLVDLGRNDLGRVCSFGSITLERILDVERYSHVMHLSSTITGQLRDELDAWHALRECLPVGTVSGAPKIRAMQIIDEIEPTRRGPYAGGIGAVSFGGDMDIALALRTMVFPTAQWNGTDWTVHLQAGAGVVADSNPAMEFEETVNKSAALARAIDLAEQAFRIPE